MFRDSKSSNLIRVCHIARDIEQSGGGEVVKQIAHHMALKDIDVTIVTDTARVDLGENIKITRTLFGDRLLDWTPKSRLGWNIRHLAQILLFTLSSSIIAFPLRLNGTVIFNHNCESLVGQILVMHNVFSAELYRRQLPLTRRVRAFLSPIRFCRISKEYILSRSIFNKLLVSVSESAKFDVAFLKVDPKRISVIANGVDTMKYAKTHNYKPPVIVSNWAKSEITHIVLFIGHEWKGKGLNELLEAMSLLPNGYGLVIVGGASQNVHLYTEKAKSLNLSKRVLFAGTWPDTRPFLAAANVFCLPSFSETMPLVALEALASGVPIVLTKECPASELITAGVNGYITTRNPQDIANAIIKSTSLGVTVDERLNITKSVDGHDWETVCAKYIVLTKNLLTSRSSSRKK